MARAMGERTTMTRNFLKLVEQRRIRVQVPRILMKARPDELESQPPFCPPPARSAALGPSTRQTDRDTVTACRRTAPRPAGDELRQSSHPRPLRSRPAKAE